MHRLVHRYEERVELALTHEKVKVFEHGVALRAWSGCRFVTSPATFSIGALISILFNADRRFAVFENTWATTSSQASYNFFSVTNSKRRRARRIRRKLAKTQTRDAAKPAQVPVTVPVAPCTAPESLEAAAAVLDRVAENLVNAHQIVNDVYVIGVWSTSDDSSDNRQRRKGLREADWAASGASSKLRSFETTEPELQRDFALLDADIRAVVADLELLLDTVSNIMDSTLALDVSINDAKAQIEALRERCLGIASEYIRRAQLARQQ
jgi:hypothetical protein